MLLTSRSWSGSPQPGSYPDHYVDCEEAMDIAMTELVDVARLAGWRASRGSGRYFTAGPKPVPVIRF